MALWTAGACSDERPRLAGRYRPPPRATGSARPIIIRRRCAASGCDCLGLVRGLWREFYGAEPEPLPAYSPQLGRKPGQGNAAQAAARHLLPLALGEERPGDMLLFRWKAHLPAKHCAILSGPAQIIHAHDGAAVTEVAYTPWWRRHLSHVFSFPGGRATDGDRSFCRSPANALGVGRWAARSGP